MKSAAKYPAPVGGVTEVNVHRSPISRPCAILFTVTSFCVFTVVKVAPVIGVSNGVIS